MNNYDDRRPKMRLRWIFIFILLLPTIIFGGYLFYEYENYSLNEEEAKNLYDEAEDMEEILERDSEHFVTHYFKLSNGNSLAMTDVTEGLELIEWNPDSLEIIDSSLMETIIFNEIVSSYQNDGITMLTSTRDEESKHFYYESDKSLIELDVPSITDSPFIEQTTIRYDQTLYTVGQNESEAFIVIIVNGDESEIINLSEIPELSLLVDAEFNNPSFLDSEEAFPILKLRTYNQENYYVVLDPNLDDNYTLYKDKEELEEENELYKRRLDSSTPYIHIHSNQLHFSNGDNSTDRVKMETPKEIFYPAIFSLSGDNVAIIGKDSIKDNATKIGYIYDSTGRELRFDLSPFITENQELFTDYEDMTFQIQLQNDILYTMSNQQAYALDLASSSSLPPADWNAFSEMYTHLKTAKENEAAETLAAGQAHSTEKLRDYLENSSHVKAVVISWIVSTLFIILMMIVPVLVSRRYMKHIQAAYDNGGGLVQTTIESIRQTGVYINDQPQVELIVSFTYNNQQYERSIKITTSLINPIGRTDTVAFVYDPILDKLYEIKHGLNRV